MTWVKICGMTNLEDALVAVDAGADAVGFVFYEKSPRCVTVEAAREIVNKLPKNIEKVGVFAGESLSRAVEIGACVAVRFTAGLPDVRSEKHHRCGESGPAKTGEILLRFPIEKFVSDDHGITFDVTKRPKNTFAAILIDSGGGPQPGGTGVPFDWNSAASIVASLSRTEYVVIAGGLNPQNVSEAIQILWPWGVDVVSGVEAWPGKKIRRRCGRLYGRCGKSIGI